MSESLGRRWTPGPSPLTTKRDLYLRLMKQGMTNSAACEAAGVNRRTGSRWRYGRTVTTEAGQLHYPPISSTVEVEGGSRRFLSDVDRFVIADGLRAGRSHRAIAGELGRHPTTVGREVTRNCDSVSGEYRPFAAHRLALSRRARPKPRRADTNEELCRVVQGRLDKRWSPEQTSAWLVGECPDRGDLRACHETIYQAIYAPSSRLRRDDRPVLRTGRRHRRQRRNGARLERFTEPMVNVSERPDSAADRVEAGHWEGDLIIGTYNRSAIGTLVERTTRATLLVHFAGGRRSEELRDEMTAMFEQFPASLRRSLTWDQGIEMARHHESPRPAASPCSSVIEPARGSDRATRTPTDCSATIFRKGQTCRSTLRKTSPPLPANSTSDPERPSDGPPPQRCSLPCWNRLRCNDHLNPPRRSHAHRNSPPVLIEFPTCEAWSA